MDFDGPAPHPGPDGPGLAHGAAGDQKPPPPIELPPNNSIYINNISEKIKIQTLLTELQAIFEQFGNILEIHAKKNLRMRGQAFIVFEEVESAQKAVNSMQGFPFHDKKMRIAFAKRDSDLIAKKKGTFFEKDRSKKDKKKKKKKDKKVNPMQAMMSMMNPQMMMQMQKMMAQGGMQGGMNMQAMAKMMPQMQANMQKMMTQMQGGGAPAAVPGVAPGAAVPLPSAVPAPNMGLPEGKFGSNNIIFVQDLPEEVDEKMLTALFNQFDNFMEVRMAPSKTGRAAFIEYTNERSAANAKDTLQGFKVTPTTQLKITFAKK